MLASADFICPSRVRARYRARVRVDGYNELCRPLKKIPHYTILDYIVRNDTNQKGEEL